jgi:hypothetical protein
MTNHVDSQQTRVGIEKRYELYQDYIKTVLSLSTGALVLSITFLHDVLGTGSDRAPRTVSHHEVLGLAWLAFVLSILSSLIYLYFLALAARDSAEFHSGPLKWGAYCSVFGFAAGLGLMVCFGLLNFP